jgi:hypothetical protein
LSAALFEPSLWAFQIAVAEYGFPKAVEVCRTRELGPALAARFMELSYHVGNLPPYEVVRHLLTGVLLTANKHGHEKWKTTAGRLGMDIPEAENGRRALRYFGCKIMETLGLMRIRRECTKRSSTGNSARPRTRLRAGDAPYAFPIHRFECPGVGVADGV